MMTATLDDPMARIKDLESQLATNDAKWLATCEELKAEHYRYVKDTKASPVPVIFDPKLGECRPITQEGVDMMCAIAAACACLIEALETTRERIAAAREGKPWDGKAWRPMIGER